MSAQPAGRPERTTLTFSAQSQTTAIGPLVEHIVDSCRDFLGVDEFEEQLVRVQICLTEAINNVVEHSYKGAPDRPIEATLDCDRDQIAITLLDEGIEMPGGHPPRDWDGFDPDDLENLPEGGFGWMLIREQMDVVEYARTGDRNVLRLSLSL